MANGWTSAGEAIAKRRKLRGYRTQADFARRLGVSESTIGNLERGTRTSYAQGFLESVEDAIGWLHGSVERMVQGGRPREYVDPYLARVHAAWPQLEEQIKKVVTEWIENAVR